MYEVSERGETVINGWTYYEDRDAALTADDRRNGTQSDFWTNTASRGWIDGDGVAWVLTFLVGTRELMLFGQEPPAEPAWVSPVWSSQAAAESALEGFESAGGDWDWLMGRL